MYASISEFLADLDQVFLNCRMYNGTDSIVGRIGIQVQAETEQLIRDFKLRERFGSEQEKKKFQLGEVNLQQYQARKESNVKADTQNQESGNEHSDDDIPRHNVPYHKNEQENHTAEYQLSSPRPEFQNSNDVSEKGYNQFEGVTSNQLNIQSQQVEEIFEEE